LKFQIETWPLDLTPKREGKRERNGYGNGDRDGDSTAVNQQAAIIYAT